MKKSILFFVSALFLAISAQAQFVKVETWMRPNVDGVKNLAVSNVFVAQKLNNTFAATAFLLTGTGGFSEALFGIKTKIAPKTNFGISIGFEAGADKLLRFGSSFSTSYKKLSLLAIGEYGVNESYWYKYYLKNSVKKISYGIFGQRFAGHGLRLDMKLSKHFNVWLAGVYDTEVKKINIPFGIYVKF